jgi:hypothetical protein
MAACAPTPVVVRGACDLRAERSRIRSAQTSAGTGFNGLARIGVRQTILYSTARPDFAIARDGLRSTDGVA